MPGHRNLKLGPISVETIKTPGKGDWVQYLIILRAGKDSFKTGFEVSYVEPVESVVLGVLSDLYEASEIVWPKKFMDDAVGNRGLEEKEAWALWGFARRNAAQVKKALDILERRCQR